MIEISNHENRVKYVCPRCGKEDWIDKCEIPKCFYCDYQEELKEPVPMTLDEAILHAKEVSCGVKSQCGAEHSQLVYWLEDYKRLLQKELRAEQEENPCGIPCSSCYLNRNCMRQVHARSSKTNSC